MSFHYLKGYVHAQLLSHIWLFWTPWTAAFQASLSMEFSRQEYWSRLPFPTPGDLPDLGIEPMSPAPPGAIGRILYQCATWDPRKTRMILFFHYVLGRFFTVWATRQVPVFHCTSTKSSIKTQKSNKLNPKKFLYCLKSSLNVDPLGSFHTFR